jgi:glycosyltransferase involved in cell wall biosynthesis
MNPRGKQSKTIPMQKKHLLLINRTPFGHHAGSYQFCVFLRDAYSITYVCFDYGFPRISLDGVEVVYVPQRGSRVRRFAQFLTAIRRQLAASRPHLVFLAYFQGCSLLRLSLRGIPAILHIATGSVKASLNARRRENLLLAAESRAFHRVTILSESFLEPLHLDPRRCTVLPLGSPVHEIPPKSLREFRLFYVGTLRNRHIERTVEGFCTFAGEMQGILETSYDIVGDGLPGDVGCLMEACRSHPLGSLVTYHGRIPHAELGPFFARCTVGVAFVPITEYYQFQPVTKVFEYLLAGMPVIATDTLENRKVIDGMNGVLIQDTAEGFHRGLRDLYEARARFEPENIRKASAHYSWEQIVSRRLRPLLEEAAGAA